MMDVLKWVPLLILVVLILILLIGNIVIVQQSKAYVVERLGAFRTVWGVGLHLKVPFVERVAKKVSLKEQVADFAPQPVITKDNVTMQILYTYGVERPMNAIENLTATNPAEHHRRDGTGPVPDKPGHHQRQDARYHGAGGLIGIADKEREMRPVPLLCVDLPENQESERTDKRCRFPCGSLICTPVIWYVTVW